MEKYILVTGGAGYIGSHVCKLLSKSGYTPVVYDNLSSGHEYATKFGEFVQGDLHDIKLLDQVCKKYKPQAVIHFAAYIQVGESVKNPSIYYENNVVGTLRLLDTMIKNEIKHIVFSSTAAVYGMPKTVPIDENAIKAPINPYGASKQMMEQIMDDYNTAYGLKSVRLRYFNASGASRDGDIGENHTPETHLIPVILRAALHDLSFNLMGDDYDTPDGTCIRDYIHVDDLAKAHLLSLEYLLKGGETNYFNLGTGKGYSCKEILLAAEKVVGKKIKVNYVARRAGDPSQLIASPKKAEAVLGFTTQHSDLNNIIQSAYDWHKTKKNL